MRDVVIYTCEAAHIMSVITKYQTDVPQRNQVTVCPCIRNVDEYINRIKTHVGNATQRVFVFSHGASNSGWGLMKLNASGNGRLLTASALQNHKDWNAVKRKLNNKDLFLLGCQTATVSTGGTLVVFTKSGTSKKYNSLESLFKTTCKNTYTVRGLMYQGPAGNGNQLAFGSKTNYKTLFEIVRRPQTTALVRTKR